MGRSRGYVHRVDIHADVTDVWQALIDPAILARWHVANARVDAREGGSYWTRLAPKFEREAHIDIYKPPQRLRLLYMPSPDLPDTGVVPIDDFLIDRDEAATRAAGAPVTVLRLMGSGIPETREWDPTFIRLRGGWERALLRLKALFERGAHGAQRADAAADTATTSRARAQAPAPKQGQAAEGKTWPGADSGRDGKPPQPADDFIPWPESTPEKKR